MRTTLSAVCVAALALGAAACGSSSSTPPADPVSAAAQSLAAADGGKHSATEYRTVLQDLAAKCSQSAAQLGNMVEPVMSGFKGAGITDEDRLSVLQHIDQSMPSGTSGMDCVQQYAAYETLREGG